VGKAKDLVLLGEVYPERGDGLERRKGEGSRRAQETTLGRGFVEVRNLLAQVYLTLLLACVIFARASPSPEREGNMVRSAYRD